MKEIESKYLIDSSVWLSYFFAENKKTEEIIESHSLLFTSVVSLFEIKRKLIKEKYSEDKVLEILMFIKEKSIVIKLDIKICEKAAEISIENKLPAIDSLIYTTSLVNDCKLVTGDNDFRGLKDVIIIS